MTANTPPPRETGGSPPSISSTGFHWPALGYRTVLVDSDGGEITNLNPVYVQVVDDLGVIIDFATEAKQDEIIENQIDGSQKNQIVDELGNIIGATDNALDINIKSGVDIQIGAVEIKDGESDTRLNVELDTTKNASFVQSESLASSNNQTDGSQKTGLIYTKNPDGLIQNVTNQDPLPTNGDAVYCKDIWEAQSNMGDFSGNVCDLFDNLHTIVENTTSDNPKTLFIHFNRTIVSNAIGLGSFSGDFSNVKIEIANSGAVFTTVIDESSSNTKYTSRTFQLPVTPGFNAIRFTFHTIDSVTLSNCVILKSLGVIARLQAVKPDGTVIDLNATAGGNSKFSLEELESGISVNSNSQLKVTPYDSTGVEGIKTISSTDLIGMGDLTVGTSQVEITFTGITKTIRIRADLTNTGIIYIGKTGVLADGSNDMVRLEAGDELILNYNDVTNSLYAISTSVAQKLNRGASL